MSERDEIQRLEDELQLLREAKPLMEELEAARATKDTDRARWEAAVEALDGENGLRTYWRRIADFLREQAKLDAVTPELIEVNAIAEEAS